MKTKIILLILLLCTLTSAAAQDFPKEMLNLTNIQQGPGGEQNHELTNDMIHQFCYQVQSSLIWMVGFAMLFWIAEPKIRQKLSNLQREDNSAIVNYLVEGDSIPFLIKWIGIGLLFMVGYSLFVLM